MKHIKRILSSAAMLVVVTISSVGNNVVAQNSQTEIQQALNMIADFAAKTCADIPLTGNGIELTGEGKAELSGIFKKIADLGIEGAVKYQKYEGLYQKDLVKALHNSTSCKFEVFKELKDIFFPPKDAHIPKNDISIHNWFDERSLKSDVKVFIDGSYVGMLSTDQNRPFAELTTTVPQSGSYKYKLLGEETIWFDVKMNDNTWTQRAEKITYRGSGTIFIEPGQAYEVDRKYNLNRNSWEAALHPVFGCEEAFRVDEDGKMICISLTDLEFDLSRE